ncbi:MAG: hypothetical protein IJU01_00495 [Lachnospiraceae bacterium]|nr:hypothetical protein [Lachnospiraceae bacterium]
MANVKQTQIETKTGFKVSIDKSVLDDMELLELLSEMSSGTPEGTMKLPGVIEKILGAGDKKRLYDHLRTRDGRVPVSMVETELKEIIAGLNEKK